MGLSHSLTLVSVSPFYSLFHLSILFFFFLGFFCFLRNSVWTLVLSVLFCFFFFNRLPGSWAPGLEGFIALGLAGWWAGGVHDILGGGPSKKLRGAQALFFLFPENFTWKIFFFWVRGGPGPLRDQRGSVPGNGGLSHWKLMRELLCTNYSNGRDMRLIWVSAWNFFRLRQISEITREYKFITWVECVRVILFIY